MRPVICCSAMIRVFRFAGKLSSPSVTYWLAPQVSTLRTPRWSTRIHRRWRSVSAISLHSLLTPALLRRCLLLPLLSQR